MKANSFSSAIIICIISAFIFCSCKNKSITPSFEFSPYICAYTGGLISSDATIKIEFTQEHHLANIGEEIDGKLFRFSPSIKGKAYQVSNNIIEFIPDSGALKPGTMYNAAFKLGKIMKVEKKLRKFEFSFKVRELTFQLETAGITVSEDNPQVVRVDGEIQFSEKTSPDIVKKIISGKFGKEKMQPVITANGDGLSFHFLFENIIKKEKEEKLVITADGKKVNIDNKIIDKVVIPAKGIYGLYQASVIHKPENGVRILFTEPLSATQDLNGLIQLTGINDLSFQRQDNEIIIFFEKQYTADNSVTLIIDKNLENYAGKRLGETVEMELTLMPESPEVKILTTGTIMPNAEKLVIPFKTMALQAVDVEIIKIFESNILQFLQINTLSSSDELKRSGRLVYKKKLLLSGHSSTDWEYYSIDLEKLIEQEPGAIYQIRLSFNRSYTTPPFNNGTASEKDAHEGMTVVSENRLSEEDEGKWDYQQYYGYYDNDDMDWSVYEWSERNNPYHPSYYMESGRKAVTNVLASDIGIIAKSNGSNQYWIAVSNIIDTKPYKDVTVTLYNYQLQAIGSSKTDQDGFAFIETKNSAFAAIASIGKEKSYLRLVDGEELSLSRFDVEGSKTEKGLKGFIYGERGVWRPGDTLFLAFMLEDRENRIPDNHPVTIELYNPRGQFSYKQTATQSVNRLYTFPIPTSQDAPTGMWNAYIKVGGATFHKSLRMEAIKPNRLKIVLQAKESLLTAAQKQASLQLHAEWLTGATANQLRAVVEMNLKQNSRPFKGYEKYIFNNPAMSYSGKPQKIFDGHLNKEGDAAILFHNYFSDEAPGMLTAQYECRVFEPGGDASIYNQSIPLSPFEYYVGICFNMDKEKQTIETDRNHPFDIITLDEKGKPVSRKNIEYKIYKIDWSWWWENNDKIFSSYINSTSIEPVYSGTVSTVNGKGKIDFCVKYPAWGRFLVYVKDPESGHATGGIVHVDWPSWRGQSNKNDPDGIKMLSFSTDKKEYQVGETVTVMIPPAAAGTALVSIENGTTLLMRKWVKTKNEEATKFTFSVTEEMTPTIYVHISLLQPHAQTVNDLPIRLYGVIPLNIINRQLQLFPVITSPKVIRPETPFTIKVKEKNGHAMTYTLAIVDEGLLSFTNFKTPDPWNHFYAREALGIKTWDLYDDVVGAYAGNYGSLFSIGGDETLNRSNTNANRFMPLVRFMGPFTLNKGGEKTHKITLPNYMGAVRVMVVAGENGAYGSSDEDIVVRAPLMAVATLPRVLSVNEKIQLPVNIFAMEKEVKDITVTVETGGNLKVLNGSKKTLHFTTTGDKMVYFELESGKSTGKEKVTVTATCNGHQSKDIINIEIRNPNPIMYHAESKLIDKGKAVVIPYRFSSMNKENMLQLEISGIPSVNYSGRIDFLNNYEHSCSEQVTSKAFPLLYQSLFTTLTDKELKATQASVNKAIKTLYERQLHNGGFVCWETDRQPNDWVTSYVGCFLINAKKQGYAVDGSIINKWVKYQKRSAQNWSNDRVSGGRRYQIQQNDLEQAYRLYSLALANMPEQGAMNRMREDRQLSTQARWYLAAAYALCGKSNIANQLIINTPTQIAAYSSDNSTFGSNLRDEAFILETLLLLNKQKEAFQQAQHLSQQLAKETNYTTQSTAFALKALAQLVQSISGNIKAEYDYNGQVNKVNLSKTFYKKELVVSKSKGSITVRNEGSGIIYANLISKTHPLVDTLPAMNNNLKIKVNYYDMNGKIINIEQLEKGSDLFAEITITNINNTYDYHDLALTHIIPSGFEIYNERLSKNDYADNQENYHYQDIRDDRIYTYFDLPRGKSKVIRIRLQASYGGDFILPAILCEAMYDPSVFARTKAHRVKIN